MEREQLLTILVPLLVQESATQSDAKNVLSTYSTDELHQQFYKAVNAGRLKPDGTLVRTTTPAPQVTQADIDKAKLDHQRELSKIRADAERERINVEMERALEFERFQMDKERSEAPKREAQLRQDRETFVDAARVLRSFGLNVANFNLLRSTLGLGNLSEYTIKQAIESNAVSLAPATEEQLAEYQREDIEARNQYLANADPATLRVEVRKEAEARRLQQQRQEGEAADAARKARDIPRGYPPLPPEISKDVIKKASTERLKDLIRKYGNDALTNRLRDVA